MRPSHWNIPPPINFDPCNATVILLAKTSRRLAAIPAKSMPTFARPFRLPAHRRMILIRQNLKLPLPAE